MLFSRNRICYTVYGREIMRSTHHTDTIRLMANYVVSATKRIGRRLLCAPLVKRAVSLWHRRGVPKAVLGVATIALTFGLFA